MIRSGMHLAATEEEKEAVYRFRNHVYVEEMGRYGDTADHENRPRRARGDGRLSADPESKLHPEDADR